jgi:hypothetical protein
LSVCQIISKLKSGSTVKVFDERIEIYNPGKLPVGFALRRLLESFDLTQSRRVAKKGCTAFNQKGFVLDSLCVLASLRYEGF